MPYLKYAFRCRRCGHLEEAGQAACSSHPVACRVCNAGVSFHSTTGVKTVNPDNWEILADAKQERLAELGLKPDSVERHEPWPADQSHVPKVIDSQASETTKVADSAGKS